MDNSDQKQAELGTKLQAISEGLSGVKVNITLLAALDDMIALSEASLHMLNHFAILNALRPQTASQRFDEIKDPTAGSFAWMLRDSADKVSPEKGNDSKTGGGPETSALKTEQSSHAESLLHR